MRRVAIAVAALTFASVAHADYNFSWEKATADREFDEQMARARAAMIASAARRSQRNGLELARRAYFRLEAALLRKPKHAEANYMAAELISSWNFEDYGSRRTWLDRGIKHYGAYLDNAPIDTRKRSALFNRSILLSKRAAIQPSVVPDFRLAIADYDKQLAMTDFDSSDSWEKRTLATTLSNAAELHMGIGELDRAIERYLLSLEAEKRSLYQFGLAVALDRDGQRSRASAVARAAIQADSPDQRYRRCELDRRGVFFVPEGDKSYYLALRAEVLGKYAEARRHYRVFLNKLPKSVYAKTARANLASIRLKRDTWKPNGKQCQ